MRRLVVCGALMVLTACGSPQQASQQQTLPTGTTPTTTTTTGSSSPAAPVPPAQTTPSTPAAPASTRCTAAGLTGKVEPTEAGAGNRYGRFVVTNTGPAECTINGYSGFQLLDANGQPVPTNLVRTQDPGPSPITLAPGASAAAKLHWSVVPAGDEPVDQPCRPDAANAAAIPPDETRPMSLAWGLGPVCAGGKIEISAFYAA
ncbi:hypothetical protein FHS29_003044 [Saccharothrix tamanrassetensis]|uniref:DUF4232 domain-containing protein n=1 Tax=Saccharothrix tamanrassetensis TaxID=1051531 RepID=A0A841CJV6_9PSEU|nr:DUF4232 domain-containing protein [Saccharothrix tamanrassetensis]MBB5956458.1 hypothetical protein [Saccharothrix tamanrassetensis]